jgi:hypothetical protein
VFLSDQFNYLSAIVESERIAGFSQDSVFVVSASWNTMQFGLYRPMFYDWIYHLIPGSNKGAVNQLDFPNHPQPAKK